MRKTNNLGIFPAEIPVRVFPTSGWKLRGRNKGNKGTSEPGDRDITDVWANL